MGPPAEPAADLGNSNWEPGLSFVTTVVGGKARPGRMVLRDTPTAGIPA